MPSAAYTTGPIENATGLTTQVASQLFAKVLNHNMADFATVEVRIFRLDADLRELVGTSTITVGPKSSDFQVVFLPANTFQYEVLFIIDTNANPDFVLVSSWGKNAAGEIIAAQRVVHAEMHRIG